MTDDPDNETPFDEEESDADQEPEDDGQVEESILTEPNDDLESMLAEIERRAEAAGLPVKRLEHQTDGHPIVEVQLTDEGGAPEGRLRAGSVERAAELLASPFEDYRLVPGYAAIYSTSTGEIEARIRQGGLLPQFGMRDRPPLDKPYEISDGQRHPGKAIEISMSSPLFGSTRVVPMPRGRSVPVFRFRGFGSTTASAAKAVLDELGTALLFELDLAYGIPLELVRRQEIPRRPASGRERSDDPPSFPRNAYDPEPVALYMYGRAARGMPLLQFLAYYQAVEFYFPRYSEAELRRQLETIVKDPRFNAHRDRDIGRLLSIGLGDRRRSVGNERDQLQATMRACLQADEIRDFVDSDPERTAFFADRRSALTSCTISLRDQAVDLRDAAAKRIYDLRCKIVHTKDGPGDEQIDLLLPNSPEARRLYEDIELLELVATRVIVASSRERPAS